jgi:hypothetical protein
MTGFTTDAWLQVLDEKSKHKHPDVAQLARLLRQAILHAQDGRCDEILHMLDVEATEAMERVNP